MVVNKLISRLDHTYSSETLKWDNIREICDYGIEFGKASICIPLQFVKSAKGYVNDRLKVSTIIGLSRETHSSEKTIFEAKQALENGADEIDIFIDIQDIKQERYESIVEEINAVRGICGECVLKIIVDIYALTDEEKIQICTIATKAGIDFIKINETDCENDLEKNNAIHFMRLNVGNKTKILESVFCNVNTNGVNISDKFPIASVTLLNHSISDYVLAVPTDNIDYRKAASMFNYMLSKACGIQLRFKTLSELEPNELYILFDQDRIDPLPYIYRISNVNGVLCFLGQSAVITDAIERYLSEAFCDRSGDVELYLPQNDILGYGGEYNGLVLSNETKETVADGIEYRLQKYVDRNGAPVQAHSLIVDPGKATAINGTPNGGYELFNVNATTLEAALSAESQGYKVVAGINGDFFRPKTDFKPAGICVKNGIKLQVTNDRPFFGVSSNGTPFIGEGTLFDEIGDSIVEAVGGSNVILKNGKINSVDFGLDSGYIRHPRTSVGCVGDGRIYFLVVDGRQPELSNGASMTDLAIIMSNLGATDALNLDGGASSTFLLKRNNEFEIMNSPCKGELRKIFSSLLVVLKK